MASLCQHWTPELCTTLLTDPSHPILYLNHLMQMFNIQCSNKQFSGTDMECVMLNVSFYTIFFSGSYTVGLLAKSIYDKHEKIVTDNWQKQLAN